MIKETHLAKYKAKNPSAHQLADEPRHHNSDAEQKVCWGEWCDEQVTWPAEIWVAENGQDDEGVAHDRAEGQHGQEERLSKSVRKSKSIRQLMSVGNLSFLGFRRT